MVSRNATWNAVWRAIVLSLSARHEVRGRSLKVPDITNLCKSFNDRQISPNCDQSFEYRRVICNAALIIILQEFADDNGLRKSAIFLHSYHVLHARSKFSTVRFYVRLHTSDYCTKFMKKLVWFVLNMFRVHFYFVSYHYYDHCLGLR